MIERYVTPSKITAWLDCDYFLVLKHEVEDGLRELPVGGMNSFAQLLADKGIQHELACLAEYELQGKSILRVSGRSERESFKNWVARVGNPFDQGWDVIYQVPFIDQGIRGIADFLVRAVDDDGVVTYEPVDAKLARKEAKPGHVLQLCFYADAIEASTGRRPRKMHLWLGSGNIETLAVGDFGAYWRRMRTQLSQVLDASPDALLTSAEPCNHCAICEFADVCESQWRAEDSLIYVTGLRSSERLTLADGGVSTLAALADRTEPVNGLGLERLAHVVIQADLQRQAREAELDRPPFVVIEAGDHPVWGHGFDQLPAPDDGDVFLDFEGHPFWRADRGLFFLFGLIERDATGEWCYRTWWAHTPEEEGAAAQSLIEYLAARRVQHPGMHIYHYNHTERSSLERLVEEYGLGEITLAHLVDTGAFVDLLLVARNAIQVGAESYGLKALERLTTYDRGHDIDQGAGAVIEYERYMVEGAVDALTSIAAYNEDDVRATRALRDWLIDHRPTDLPWRPAELEPADDIPELDEQIARLHAFGPDTVHHLMGDLLGYWRREWSAHLAPLRARCDASKEDLLADPEAIAGLTWLGEFERTGKAGKVLTPVMRFSLPPQDLGALRDGDQVIFATPEGGVGYTSITRLDTETGQVDLLWSENTSELECIPSVVIRNDWVAPKPKPAALSELAECILDPIGSPPNPVALALLCRDLPAFVPGGGPPGGIFSDDLGEMLAWATQLDRSYVAIQGPPGTGKTFSGAHLVRTLIKAGKRVGITAMSHHAIDNLLEAIVEVFDEAGDDQDLRAVKRGSEPSRGGLKGVTYAASNAKAANGNYNLIAGTTWLFSGNDMSMAPVDVLLIDEAGQLALADALAACRSARNLILLGDPLQLPQVARAAHPGGSGRSVLEHVLGDAVTIPADRGVFLSETRRMHPDVCTFISDEIYEGRLTSHLNCVGQGTEFGTGLRWLPAHHSGRVTESEEEAEIVAAEIGRLLGTMWTNHYGETKPLRVDDILVVAPYNDQVNLLRARLDADPWTYGVPVGTVDKFQGRQAALVFFTMTTSTAADMSRSAEFLFSRNRFNVAISRARCLAYLVCTEELLNSRGRDIEEMRLISTICSFVEASQRQHAN